jgi:hypothetical protein
MQKKLRAPQPPLETTRAALLPPKSSYSAESVSRGWGGIYPPFFRSEWMGKKERLDELGRAMDEYWNRMDEPRLREVRTTRIIVRANEISRCR